MTVVVSPALSAVARALNLPEADLFQQAARALLERRLREVKAEIFRLCGQYGVSSVAEMEARYREDTLEEGESWRDFQQLDHLEFERDQLSQLMENLK